MNNLNVHYQKKLQFTQDDLIKGVLLKHIYTGVHLIVQDRGRHFFCLLYSSLHLWSYSHLPQELVFNVQYVRHVVFKGSSFSSLSAVSPKSCRR